MVLITSVCEVIILTFFFLLVDEDRSQSQTHEVNSRPSFVEAAQLDPTCMELLSSEDGKTPSASERPPEPPK